MDLERIKQNLRLRSGRGSKPKKTTRPKAAKQPDIPQTNGVPQQPASPSAPQQPSQGPPKSNVQGKIDESILHLTDNQAGPPPAHRPELPHAATGLDNDPNQNKYTQYGRSGISILNQSHNQRASIPLQRTMTDPQVNATDMDDVNFDLKAPTSKPRPPSIEKQSELLFSAEYLNSILHEPKDIARFTAFLTKYKPEYHPLILRYLETQKAIKAVEYANAVAEGATVASDEEEKAVEAAIPAVAATLDHQFEHASTSAFTALVGTALPMYITYCLVKLVSECLINEITGKQTPIMRNLVGGLSEVFCITDPKQEENPIIYASEEFYRLTGYGRDDVIDHNCRFLQGRKTLPESVKRLGESVRRGEEHCETLLNYRRDGRAFVNLLMTAPLHDDKGEIKYFIGAQVDVTGLIEDGRGLDSFEKFLTSRQARVEQAAVNGDAESARKKKVLKKLRELSEMFDLEESAVVQTNSRSSSLSRESDTGSKGSTERRRGNRRLFVASDESDEEEDTNQEDGKESWRLGQAGPLGLSGKLPGIYDSYMLIRPASSLRIIFVSPKLRKLGKVIQSPFLAHVAAPAVTLMGLKESFATGTPVSAKINFLPEAGESKDGTRMSPGQKHEDGKFGRVCWISATPLLGSDDKVGVWMIVVVERSKAGKTTRAAEVEAKAVNKTQRKPDHIELPKRGASARGRPQPGQKPVNDVPIKPKRLDELKTDEVDTSSAAPNGGEQISSTPQTPKKTSQALENGDDPFILTKSDPKKAEADDRVEDEGQGGISHNAEKQEDWHPTGSQSHRQDLFREDRKYTPPPEIPDSMVGATSPARTPGEVQLRLEDFNVERQTDSVNGHDFENTPTRAKFDDDEDDDTPTRKAGSINEAEDDSTGEAGHLHDHNQPGDVNHQPNILAMDYLRHPGSQPVQSRKNRQVREDDRWTDVDCMRSPFSVD